MVRFVVDDALLERLARWRGNVLGRDASQPARPPARADPGPVRRRDRCLNSAAAEFYRPALADSGYDGATSAATWSRPTVIRRRQNGAVGQRRSMP